MSQKKQKKPPPTFTERHAENISKLKLILIVVCLVAIPVSFLWTQSDVGSVSNRITKIESPCQRFGSESKVCEEAFETAVKSITHRIACYIDRKAGKPFKDSCVGVKLRIEQAKPAHTEPHNAAPHTTPSELQAGPDSGIGNGGDAESTPPNQGSSQPAPGNGGAGNHGGSGGNDGQPGNPAPSSPTHSQQPSASAPSTPSTSSSSSDSSSSTDAPTESPPPVQPPTPPAEPPPDTASPGLLNPVTESPLVTPLVPDCHLNVLGIQICN